MPISSLYNSTVNKVKTDHIAHNEYLKNLYLPVEPPEFLQIFNKKDVLLYDQKK